MDIFRLAGSFNCIISPTDLCMPPQVACGRCIRSVQIPMNMLTVSSFAFAVLCPTLKNMKTAATDVVNEGD